MNLEMKKLTRILDAKLWCDWQLEAVSGLDLVVSGGESLSYPPKIRITMKDVDVFSGPMEWTTEPGDVFIADDTLLGEISLKFGVESERGVLVFLDRHRDSRPVYFALKSFEITGAWVDELADTTEL